MKNNYPITVTQSLIFIVVNQEKGKKNTENKKVEGNVTSVELIIFQFTHVCKYYVFIYTYKRKKMKTTTR